MTRSRSSLLAMTWPFRSQAQIQLPAPGLDNDQTALPQEGQYRQMPAPCPHPPPPGLYIDTCITVINHKQSFSLSQKYFNIHEEGYLRTLAFASTAFLHNKIKLHFVTFYRSHCHFHHSIMYSVNKAIKITFIQILVPDRNL